MDCHECYLCGSLAQSPAYLGTQLCVRIARALKGLFLGPVFSAGSWVAFEEELQVSSYKKANSSKQV